MIISQIVAVSLNNVIGKDNGLPWHMPTDMTYFISTTWGHHIVTGRRNYEAEGKALPGRVNIVLTRNSKFRIQDGIVVHELEEAIRIAERAGETELFIVGGAEIYKLAMPVTQRIYLTRIHAHIEGDTFYPQPDLTGWNQISIDRRKTDANNPYDYDFIIYDRP
jgi:dihydrofolate reductase